MLDLYFVLGFCSLHSLFFRLETDNLSIGSITKIVLVVLDTARSVLILIVLLFASRVNIYFWKSLHIEITE